LVYVDRDGGIANAIVGGIVGAISGGMDAYKSGESVWRGVGAGAAEGVIAGLGVDIGLLSVVAAVKTGGYSLLGLVFVPGFGGLGNYTGQKIRGVPKGEVDWFEVWSAAAFNIVDFGITAMMGGVPVLGKATKISPVKRYLTASLRTLIPDATIFAEQILSFAFSALPQWVIDLIRENEENIEIPQFDMPECVIE